MTRSRYNPIKTNLRAMSDSRYFYLHRTTLRKVAKCSWSISGLRRATSGPNVEHRFWTWSLTPWSDEAYGMFWEVGKSALQKGAKWVITVSETVGPCSASESVHSVSHCPMEAELGWNVNEHDTRWGFKYVCMICFGLCSPMIHH